MFEDGQDEAVTAALHGFPGIAVAISVDASAWSQAIPYEALEALTLRALGAAAGHVGLPTALETEISVTFSDDATVREANREWRGKDKPTNILSFPMVQLTPGDLPGLLAGDLLIAFETVAKEAAADEKSLADHLGHLLVHGLLHLLGHDHIEDDEAAAMEALEIAILAGLGIADPYGDRPLRTVPAGTRDPLA
ncbi:rRNA maturation RNase YbeY [Jiella endophytica]|uniref:Endoribonuclease YbeY n=1 Tax=Jiella endophytica TaxID=2558362 RepID=A0A4Y8RQ18_9HYPH|nr:rRNA maturation RNase YbeY [Jiella endophytica]TFF25446.1 rRNA maturation RNase YbeY [Jiella endophytica]